MIKVGIECEALEGAELWGVGRVVEQLLTALASRSELGNEFKFFLYFKSGIPARSYLAHPLFVKRVVRLPVLPPSFSLYYYVLLPVRLWFERLDVMYFPNYMLPLLFSGRSLVTLTEDIYDEIRNPQLPWRYRLAYWMFCGWAARRATRIAAVSGASRRALERTFSIAPRRIAVNPLGVSTRPANVSAPARDPFLLYVGQAFPRRHLRETIRAFNRLSGDFPNLKLIAVGPDRYQPPIIPHMLNPHITHYPHVAETVLAELYAQAKAVIYVSDREAFGLPPVEALAYGTPAVVADQPVTREIFGEHAFFVNLPSCDNERLVERIAAALRQALTDTEKRRRIAVAAPAIAARYRWPAHADRWLKIVSDVAS